MALYSSDPNNNLHWRQTEEQEEFECAVERQEKRICKNLDQPGGSHDKPIIHEASVHGYVSSDEEVENLAVVNDLMKSAKIDGSERGMGDQRNLPKRKTSLRTAQSVDDLSKDCDSEMDEDHFGSIGDGPSGLTSVGPSRNMGDPRGLCRKISYGKMQEVHEYNVTDGIDECCNTVLPEIKEKLGSSRREHSGTLDMARRATKHIRTKSMTLPHNMAKWANNKWSKPNNFKSSAVNVFRKSRNFFKNTTNLLKPLIRGQGHEAPHCSKQKEDHV